MLLTTFGPALAHALHTRMRRLVGKTPRLAEQIDVASLDDLAERLYRLNFGRPKLATGEAVRAALGAAVANFSPVAANTAGRNRMGPAFLWSEWTEVVDPWQVRSWEEYRDVKRLGRKTRLSEAQRAGAWEVFAKIQEALRQDGRVTLAEVFTTLAAHYRAGAKAPFEHVVVDEAQDLGVPQLRLLAAMGAQRPNGLFFAGDLGQRIFQPPFSWKALGVDVRGRARTLTVNYRTSHQIRQQADRLLGPELADVDGNIESRRGTVSVFNGPRPQVQVCETREAEIAAVAGWIGGCVKHGVKPGEIGVFVRSEGELPRALAAVAAAGLPHHTLDDLVDTDADEVSIGTMHLAKGLEFRVVVAMACDDDVIPLQERIASITDEADLKEAYDTERHLLYVACTRARDRLMVTAAEPASEFLQDLS